MTLYLKQTLPDGATVVADNHDGAEFVLKPGQWEQIEAPPYRTYHAKRAAVEAFVLANRADSTGGRSATDEQTMETARDAASGEAHQQQEEAR